MMFYEIDYICYIKQLKFRRDIKQIFITSSSANRLSVNKRDKRLI